MTDNPIQSVVCFGGEDWWYHNRGHVDMQIMRRFSARQKVLYVNSLVMQKPRLGGNARMWMKIRRKFKSLLRGMSRVDANFYVYTPIVLPIHHVPLLSRLNRGGIGFQVSRAMRRLSMERPIVWVACPVACEAALALPRRALVYQRTDRFEEFPGVDHDQISACDRTLKREADVTVFVNRSLYGEEAHLCRNAVLLDHGVDYDLFSRAEADPRVPDEMKGLRHPIVGFFGGIDGHTSDIPFITEVARMSPDLTFVFVGAVSVDVSGLSSLPNVVMIGKRPYEEIPHYGKCFDVCIMPWRQNRWVEACNPIKLKEYLALGKPVVSTPFRELDHYQGLVYVSREPGDFAANLRLALSEDDADRRAARRARVKDHTWEAKARDVLAAIALARGEEGAV